MKWSGDLSTTSRKVIGRKPVYLVFYFLTLCHFGAIAQGKQHVLVKTFDQSLKRISNVELSFNDKAFITVGNKGEALVELDDQDIPLKSIKIKDEQFEVASWNYSKGVIEVIIRKKSYKMAYVYVQDDESNTLKNVNVVFKGLKTTTLTTDQEGKVEITLALEENITSSDQFTINDFQVISLLTSESRSVLTVRRPKAIVAPPEVKKDVKNEGRKGGNDIQLDSIQSLEEFYALFKNYQTQNMTDEMRNRLDEKLKQLMEQFADSVRGNEVQHMEKITDSSSIGDDVKNIISQATIENEKLTQQREEFNDKIRIINLKLSKGVLNIDAEARTTLLADITRLEIILESNRSSFYKNQDDYRIILNTIKEKFLNIEDLQNKLSESETQRQEDQAAFRIKILITASIAVLSASLVILLVYFSSKLRKQKHELIRANAEVKHVNENLELLVQQRTHMLEETNRELDTFLYKASHNLRSPVSSLIGLYNIANHIADPESKELFDRAVQTTYSMDRLLRKLKVISEINRTDNFSQFALLPLIVEVQTHFEKRIQDYAIKLSIECPDDLIIHSNKNLIEAILFSLMENALFYSTLKEGVSPDVQVRVTPEDGYVNLSVYDNGVGIAKSVQPHMYDMFFVGNEQSKGNGLGLYIVQKSVQAVRGSVTLESETQVFTRFTVRVPLKLVSK